MRKFLILLLSVGIFSAVVLSSSLAGDAKPIIIDVRTESEWNKGHIKGAILIPYPLIGEKIGEVVQNKSTRIYVYCRSGRRSQIAKKHLEKLGYEDVVNLGSVRDAAKALKRKIVK